MTRDQEKMLDEALGLESGLTDWEITFLDSLDSWREQTLSTRQAEILNGIVNGRRGPNIGDDDL